MYLYSKFSPFHLDISAVRNITSPSYQLTSFLGDEILCAGRCVECRLLWHPPTNWENVEAIDWNMHGRLRLQTGYLLPCQIISLHDLTECSWQ
jgi:hypothetical protein